MKATMRKWITLTFVMASGLGVLGLSAPEADGANTASKSERWDPSYEHPSEARGIGKVSARSSSTGARTGFAPAQPGGIPGKLEGKDAEGEPTRLASPLLRHATSRSARWWTRCCTPTGRPTPITLSAPALAIGMGAQLTSRQQGVCFYHSTTGRRYSF